MTDNQPKTKPMTKSWTIVWNLLTLLSISLVAVADSNIITENPVAVGAVAVLTSLVNLGLRMKTKTAIK